MRRENRHVKGSKLSAGCASCPQHVTLRQMENAGRKPDYVIALAGNPNTGKSTVFNALTGLKQHTGNWPGKTVTRAEGDFLFRESRFRVVDLPGTYSLLSASTDEEIARDFILFGRPDCTVVVTDATALERNLNLVLQVLAITDRAVICLNLMDEARKKGIVLNVRRLEKELGVPVVPTAARQEEGIEELLERIRAVASGALTPRPRRVPAAGRIEEGIRELLPDVEALFPGLPNARWITMRLLDGDPSVREAIERGQMAELAASGAESASPADAAPSPEALLERAAELEQTITSEDRDAVVHDLYARAEEIARAATRDVGQTKLRLETTLDRILTSRIFGLPIMGLMLAAVFWLTVTGSNYPSSLIAKGLFAIEDSAAGLFDALGAPWWLTGFLWHGMYRALAWVIAVMLPPMAIFFPIFTILEDAGFLPRVAFNLDRLFQKVGAHGKMALTMSMGFGCNAAGVISTRIIDSPRERLIAILTNNFVPCNGRFPTLIMLALIFVAGSVPPLFASFAAAGAVVAVTVIGVGVTLVVSLVLSRTVLRGEPSHFTLELPAFRRPRILRTLYTSLIDRTLFVLYRAILMALPAGAVIWTFATVTVGGHTLTQWVSGALDPIGRLMGLDGVILFAYIVAIPANEIVVPTIIMSYMGATQMLDLNSLGELRELFVGQQGWTLLTAVNLMLFAVLHNPCSTTILTTWKETRSAKWTTVGALMPLSIAFIVTTFVATLVRLF